MKEESVNVSETTILDAARAVFTEKGMAGARMQEIADRAGINKAMLHYYFRSKEKLFDRVFQEAFLQFWPKIEMQLSADINPRLLIKGIIGSYVELFLEKPYLPNFIISELTRDPERIEKLMLESGVAPMQLVKYVQHQMEQGVMVPMDPRELFINVIALCIFPFAGRPLISRIIWQNDQEGYTEFLKGRKASVFQFIEPIIFKD